MQPQIKLQQVIHKYLQINNSSDIMVPTPKQLKNQAYNMVSEKNKKKTRKNTGNPPHILKI